MKKLLLAILLFPFLLVGCRGSSGGDSGNQHSINVPINEVSILEGEQYTVPVEVIKRTIIVYRSNNEEIVTISRDGVITAIKEGETTVTISGGGDNFIVFVTVMAKSAEDSLQIVMPKYDFAMKKDDKFTLPLTVKYGNEAVNNPTMSYVYENEGIVSITGLEVTANAVGETKCLVTATWGELSVSELFTITVY